MVLGEKTVSLVVRASFTDLHPFSALASLVILFLHLKNSIEVMEGIEEEEKKILPYLWENWK